MNMCQCFLFLTQLHFVFFLFHNMRQQVEPEFWIAKFGFGIKLTGLFVCLGFFFFLEYNAKVQRQKYAILSFY